MSNVGQTAPQASTATPSLPSKPTPWYALAAATILLIAYLVMTGVMFFVFSGKDNPNWQNALTIYSGFQAFATAAGGVLLGTTIQQVRVAAAERDATTAKADRDKAQGVIQAARQAVTDDSGAGGGTPQQRVAALKRILG